MGTLSSNWNLSDSSFTGGRLPSVQPRPNRWRSHARPSRPVLPGDPHVQLQEDGQVLRIPSSHLGDEGRYQCVAFSPAGQQAKDFRLRMQGEPDTPVTAARCTVAGWGRDGGPGGGAPRSNTAVGRDRESGPRLLKSHCPHPQLCSFPIPDPAWDDHFFKSSPLSYMETHLFQRIFDVSTPSGKPGTLGSPSLVLRPAGVEARITCLDPGKGEGPGLENKCSKRALL